MNMWTLLCVLGFGLRMDWLKEHEKFVYKNDTFHGCGCSVFSFENRGRGGFFVMTN